MGHTRARSVWPAPLANITPERALCAHESLGETSGRNLLPLGRVSVVVNQMKMRSVLALGVSVSLAIAAPVRSTAAGAAAVAPKTAAPTQSFTGGGTGAFEQVGVEPAKHNGVYVSNGQLGSGHFYFVTYPAHGAARFTRSDGMTMTGTVDPVGDCGTVSPPAFCVSGDLTGTGDIAGAHIILAGQYDILSHAAFGVTGFLMRGTLTLRHRLGYAMVDTNGTTYAFGGIDHLGDADTTRAMDIERTPSGSGYWIVNAMGNVYAFGDARYFGNANASALSPGEVVTSMSATPTANGYWLFTSKGRAFTFGDAKTFGDLHALPLNGPIVGSVATPTGNGYYMVGSDGGVFAFGDAKFRGSMGNARLNRPVVGLVPTADNTGYWLVASDGGVFSFHAPFHGSMGAVALNRPIVTMVPYAGAYLMVASDGGVFNFSSGPFFGSEGGARVPAPIVNAASTG